MSTYKEIVGHKIKKVSSDPGEPKTGQIWYNTATGTLRGLSVLSAWASTSPLTTARADSAGAGSTPAGLVFGGTPASGVTAVTEEYNGTGFGAGGDMGTARRSLGGTGTQTAGLAIGGYVSGPAAIANVEEYNGSTWAEQNDIPTALWKVGALGVQTAAVSMGGKVVTPENEVSSTYEYDGTNWTAGGALGTGRYGATGGGTLTAGMAAGGFIVPNTQSSAVELYDGTSWTAGTSLNTARNGDANQGGGTAQTSVLVYGGTAPSSGKTESWDGTSWTEEGDMATNTNRFAGATTNSSGGFAAGGAPTSPAAKAYSEEYDKSANVITAAAWVSGANYPATIQDAAGCGPVTAAAIYGGYTTVYTNATNEYDGTSYSGGGNMNTGRATYQTGTGSQTAALQAGGYATSSHTNASEEYNGTSWSEGSNLTYSRYGAVGGGVQTSALMIGGNGGPSPSSPNAALDKTEEYDGTSWTAGGDLPAAQAGGSGFSGTSSSSAIIAGFSPPNTVTLSYDGSSWTDVGNALVQAVGNPAGGSQQGTTTAAVIAGGLTPAPAHTAFAQQYDGTSWVSAPSMSTARRGGAASGTAASCLAVGGESPQKNNTEEFTGETETTNITNFTTS